MKKYLSTFALAVLLCACSEDSDDKSAQNKQTAAASAPAGQVQSGNPAWPTYRIGTEANYPPFQYRDEHGVPIGFEVELLQAIAKAAQFNAHFVHTSRKNWEQTLNNDQFAIWSSSFTISPERQQVADFSKPFHTVENVIVVLDNEQNKNIRTAADLKGKKITVSKYSKSAPEIVARLNGSPANVIPANTFYLALKEMYSGKADGVYGQDLVLAYYGLHNPKTKIKQINVGEPKKELAFAVKKGNTELLQQINAGLDAVKADGTYHKLVQRWFGNQKPQ